MGTERRPLIIDQGQKKEMPRGDEVDEDALPEPTTRELQRKLRLLLRAWILTGFDVPEGLEDEIAPALEEQP